MYVYKNLKKKTHVYFSNSKFAVHLFHAIIYGLASLTVHLMDILLKHSLHFST